jgi:hypothetical protein
VRQNTHHNKRDCSGGGDPVREDSCILLYTWDVISSAPPQANFYHVLNHKCLREKAPDVVAALTPYLAVFEAALEKLKPRSGICYRGIRVGDALAGEKLRKSYTTGGLVTFRGYTSVSADPQVASSFMQHGHGVVFVINVVDARAISRYSQFQSENELLIAPGTSFAVSPSTSRNKNEIVLLQLASVDKTVF